MGIQVVQSHWLAATNPMKGAQWNPFNEGSINVNPANIHAHIFLSTDLFHKFTLEIIYDTISIWAFLWEIIINAISPHDWFQIGFIWVVLSQLALWEKIHQQIFYPDENSLEILFD